MTLFYVKLGVLEDNDAIEIDAPELPDLIVRRNGVYLTHYVRDKDCTHFYSGAKHIHLYHRVEALVLINQ